MINNVVLTGRLTAEPELKYTGSGTAVISFNLAVDRIFKNAQGERETDFVNCVAWRKTAELIANNLRKGSLFGVVGRIQTRNYTNNDGKKVYVTEVVCESVQFLESKNSNQHSDNNQNSRKSPDFDEDPFEKNDDPITIDDDSLPF
ncbi:single-stranded DNA-binding protein [Marinilactibacillus psychrotolerans]|uniref:Single-stranded DNA-binding protein n=1 Tax=Marinilactibacillus psychrotolerans TaxID=191770 RepID=A0A5R9C440_9LACT|nr:single-stranded DNA-binding protein [Marinilactibacillus psychrotolerans]TLQ07592.1 single-stranded DNA-binding protein [Marinilactibacillus psychrotolerans]